jgi:hypothetical protein
MDIFGCEEDWRNNFTNKVFLKAWRFRYFKSKLGEEGL